MFELKEKVVKKDIINYIIASSAMNVHFFCGIQKSFPATTTTNKPFLRPRQRSLAVKKDMK